jgi:hypothetical protein
VFTTDVARVGQGTWEFELGDERSTIRAMQRGIELE